MKNNRKAKLFAYLMTGSLLLSGCAERVNCSVSSKHVHKYVKETDNGESIVRYIESEKENIDDYIRYDDYIEITNDDEQIYKLLNNHKLFFGKDNWEYLYNMMSNNSDYVEYHYDYPSVQQYKDKDIYGRTVIKKRRVRHEGWHTNPNFVYNTGEVRICHHKYFGYNIEYSNGKFRLHRSPLVDDVREIINEYPYFCEGCIEIVYEEFIANKDELNSLTANDFTTNFSYPNLDNRSVYTAKMRIKR